MARRIGPIIGLAGVFAAVIPIVAGAQSGTNAAPVVQTEGSTAIRAKAMEMAILRKVVSLDIEHVAITDALAVIAAQSGIRLQYNEDALPADKKVSVVAKQITVGDALATVLAGTGLAITVPEPSVIRLIPRPAIWPTAGIQSQQGTATLSGAITDSGTGAIITQAVVHVDGTQLTVRTNATGHYTVSGLAAGEYRVTARHVGYLSKTRVMTLTDGATKTADFELNQPATTLNEVVTTALGDQRRYQVGNVISTINVDSIAPNAPVTDVTDLITGRAPGVDVIENTGMVGGGESIRIRGVSSMMLSGDPIIIVDGIREDNTPGGSCPPVFSCGTQSPSPSRLNDLDFNQIATIDILKGPAATTEYGTDGANGVIIITTKRGHAGSPQWTASASQSASEVPTTFPNVIWNWGHSTDGANTPFTTLAGGQQNCLVNTEGGVTGGEYDEPYYGTLEAGDCIVDSVTSFNPLNHAATTTYGTGPSGQYEVSVSGGTDAMRYYIAGGVENQEGTIHLPDVYRTEAQALGFSNSWLHPNNENQSSIRTNTTMKIGSTVDVQMNVAYMSTYAELPENGGIPLGLTPAENDSAWDYGYETGGGGVPWSDSPITDEFSQLTTQATARWTGGAVADWRPSSWFVTNLTVGIDHEASKQFFETSPQAGVLSSGFTDSMGTGSISQQQGQNDIYTVTWRGSATATVFHGVRLVTSAGANYIDTRSASVDVVAGGLSAGNYTLNGALNPEIAISALGVKSGGFYAEENLSYGDRCFLPLGFRFDLASGYGTSASATQNPNYSITCTVLSGRTSLRVRGAFGVSDQQPQFGAAVSTYLVQTGQAVTDPASNTVFTFNGPGNSLLKPERDQELEGGVDLGLWNSRVTVGLTAYNKRAHDLLYSPPLGWTIQGSIQENVGTATNIGYEAEVTMIVLQQRMVNLAVTFEGSINHNKLLTLSPNVYQSPTINDGQYFAAGYPLFSYWGYPVTYTDEAGSGVLVAPEVSIHDASPSDLAYAGPVMPPDQLSAAPSLGLWRNTIAISAMIEYEGGNKLNEIDVTAFLPQASLLDAPLWAQARDIASGGSYTNSGVGSLGDTFFNGSYCAFRELSVAYALPRTWARMARLQNLSVVGAVRNLKLWTTYPFGDPEVGLAGSSYNAASNTVATVPELRDTFEALEPLTRNWTLRLNLGL